MGAIEAFWLNDWDTTQVVEPRLYAGTPIPWNKWRTADRKKRRTAEELFLLLLEEV